MYPSFVIPDCCPLTLCTLLFWSLLAGSVRSTVRNSGLNEIADLQLLALLLCLRQSFPAHMQGLPSPESQKQTLFHKHYPVLPLPVSQPENHSNLPALQRVRNSLFPVDSEMSRASWRWRKEECCCLSYPMLRLAEQQVPGNCNVKARPKRLFVKARDVLTTL